MYYTCWIKLVLISLLYKSGRIVCSTVTRVHHTIMHVHSSAFEVDSVGHSKMKGHIDVKTAANDLY